jgi:hypothetical protein
MLAELKAFHGREIEPLLGAPIGASFEDVAALEGRLAVTLPAEYREILLWLGRDYDGALVGSDCFIDQIERNNELLPELLLENDVRHEFSGRHVTFFAHQGYQAAWFELPVVASPPIVFSFGEGGPDAVMKLPSVSGFFLEQLKGLLPAIKQVHAAGGRSRVLRGR